MKNGIVKSVQALVFAGAAALAQAQDFPSKPLKLVVPYAPGGNTDIQARLVGARMSELLGQQIVIENRPGGGTLIGTRAVLQAPADGYTLLIGGPTLAILTIVSKSAGYKSSDFIPVAGLTTIPYALSVSKSVPAGTLAELIAYGKANPGKLNFGTIGDGAGAAGLLARRFKSISGIQTVDVPYKGAGPILEDMVAGRVHLFVDGAPSSLALHKSGRIRVFAVTSEDRVAEAPDVPTFKELGYPGMVTGTWFALFARAGTPEPVVRRLGAEAQKAMNDPALRDRIAATGATPWLGSQEAFAAFVRKDLPAWEDDARRSGIQID